MSNLTTTPDAIAICEALCPGFDPYDALLCGSIEGAVFDNFYSLVRAAEPVALPPRSVRRLIFMRSPIRKGVSHVYPRIHEALCGQPLGLWHLRVRKCGRYDGGRVVDGEGIADRYGVRSPKVHLRARK